MIKETFKASSVANFFVVDRLPNDIKQDVKMEMKVQSKLGNTTYKDVWVGSGWISLDKQNNLSYKPIKGQTVNWRTL